MKRPCSQGRLTLERLENPASAGFSMSAFEPLAAPGTSPFLQFSMTGFGERGHSLQGARLPAPIMSGKLAAMVLHAQASSPIEHILAHVTSLLRHYGLPFRNH
jgi:hypothetical protein